MHATLFFWLALQSVSPEGAQHMQAGVDAHKQGQFDVAIKEFRKATESDPNLAEAFLDLGEVCLETRDYPAAVAALKRALELSPEFDAAHLQLGYALLAQGYAEEAIPHLERVNAQEALGIAQIDTGQYQDAVTNLSAALVKRPGDPDLLYYLGRASVRKYLGCIWSWGWSTLAPRDGTKLKRSFAWRPRCSQATLRPRIASALRCSNRAKRMRRGSNWSAPTS